MTDKPHRRATRFPLPRSDRFPFPTLALDRNGYPDYDGLLREALRVALRFDTHPTFDDFDDLSDRIRALVSTYINSPEGEDEDVVTLMTRLAQCLAEAIPLEERKQLFRRATAN